MSEIVEAQIRNVHLGKDTFEMPVDQIVLEVMPLPPAFEVTHPVSPQTSKRGGYGIADLCGIRFPNRRLAGPLAVLVVRKHLKMQKRVRKVIETFRTLIRAQASFH